MRVEPRRRSSDTAFILENQPVQQGRLDFLKKLRALLSIGIGVSLGGVERLFSKARPTASAPATSADNRS
jgi:hypothetical protein